MRGRRFQLNSDVHPLCIHGVHVPIRTPFTILYDREWTGWLTSFPKVASVSPSVTFVLKVVLPTVVPAMPPRGSSGVSFAFPICFAHQLKYQQKQQQLGHFVLVSFGRGKNHGRDFSKLAAAA
jgi:hypothetical protein